MISKIFLATCLVGFVFACAAAPPRLFLKDLDRYVDSGQIISGATGAPVTFDEMLADLSGCRVVYVGEIHTDTVHHEIQREILQGLLRVHPRVAVGMEMFAVTYQVVLDQWSAGQLTQEAFLEKTHWYANWRFDFSLYREILEFIQENHIRLVALNIPSHIPPKIREGGIDNLRPEEKKHLPQQIDISKTDHRDYLQDVFDGHKHHFRGEVEFESFYAAQSVWEDAMAERIFQHLKDDVMVVLAGNGHIQFKYGIPDRAFSRTAVAFRTIYLAPVGDVVELDIADYIWVTP